MKGLRDLFGISLKKLGEVKRNNGGNRSHEYIKCLDKDQIANLRHMTDLKYSLPDSDRTYKSIWERYTGCSNYADYDYTPPTWADGVREDMRSSFHYVKYAVAIVACCVAIVVRAVLQ